MVTPDAIELLAQLGGTLVGEVVDAAVRTSIAQPDGGRVVVVWPRGFVARLDPLEVLDLEGRVVARAGEPVALSGAYQAPADKAFQAAPTFVANLRVQPLAATPPLLS